MVWGTGDARLRFDSGREACRYLLRNARTRDGHFLPLTSAELVPELRAAGFLICAKDAEAMLRDLDTISLFARTRCPKSAEAICRELATKVGTLGKQIASGEPAGVREAANLAGTKLYVEEPASRSISA